MALQLTVPKLACSACTNTLTKAIQTIDSTATVQANPKTKVVSVETQASVCNCVGEIRRRHRSHFNFPLDSRLFLTRQIW
jgi:copper chaperone